MLHFLDHGEYGVALDDLKYICDTKAKPQATAVVEEVLELARIMEIDLK